MTAEPKIDDTPHLSGLYTSLPLKVGEKSIRVVDLLPGPRKQPIYIKLRVVDLAQNPRHVALSYTWGKSSRHYSITANRSHSMPVTDNLFEALFNLRSRCRTRTLWVDQICINQKDAGERSRQVAMMGQIYGAAESVHVWLGAPASNSPLFLHPPYWRQLAQVVTLLWDQGLSSELCRSAVIVAGGHSLVVESAFRRTRLHSHDRTWVVQEFLLGRKVFLCCGRKKHRLAFGARHYFRYHGAYGSGPSAPYFHFCIRLDELLRFKGVASATLSAPETHRSPYSGLGLRDAASILTAATATDPKDHVYSLLGIIDEQEASLIGCDYNLTCAQVYARATWACIQAKENLDILSLKTSREPDLELPSWAVDFSYTKDVEWFVGKSEREEHARTLQDIKIPGDMAATGYDSVSGMLTIPVIALDVIESCTPLDFHGYEITNTWSAETTIRTAAHRITSNSPSGPLRKLMMSTGVLPGHIPPVKLKGTAQTVVDASESEHFDAEKQRSKLKLFVLWESLTKSLTRTHIHAAPFYKNGGRYLVRRRELAESICVFSTACGAVGLGLVTMVAGDRIVLVKALNSFLLLRRAEGHGEGHHYTFQGHAYLHGFGDQRFWQSWRDWDLETKWYNLH